MQSRRDRRNPSQRTRTNHSQHLRRHRHPHQQRAQPLLVRPTQPQHLQQHQLERLRDPTRRMSQRHLQHLHDRAALHATPIMGTHRQHLQQPRRQPDRPLPRLHRSQRSTHRIHALAGAGGRSVGRHGERHRGRFDRGHGFEPCHHRRRPRTHHRADAFGQACHG